LDIIFAPWRYTYLKSVDAKKTSCIFCEAQKRSDDDSLILLRGRHSYVIMNLYPYNTGHVMVVPYRHVADYTELTRDEALEIHLLIKISLEAIREAYEPHGFNIGINLGRVAGAGIKDHIHVHIVPRWNGDTNFMPVIGGVKVISQDVNESYKYLKPYFQRVAERLGLTTKAK